MASDHDIDEEMTFVADRCQDPDDSWTAWVDCQVTVTGRGRTELDAVTALLDALQASVSLDREFAREIRAVIEWEDGPEWSDAVASWVERHRGRPRQPDTVHVSISRRLFRDTVRYLHHGPGGLPDPWAESGNAIHGYLRYELTRTQATDLADRIAYHADTKRGIGDGLIEMAWIQDADDTVSRIRGALDGDPTFRLDGDG